jgi:ferritin-like metal-binding protein YciE
MKFLSAHLEDLRELYVNHLQKALDMEEQIIDALPAMVENATNPQLKKALDNHLDESRNHATKVERLMLKFGKDDSLECPVLSALVSEAEAGIKDAASDAVRDVTIIAAAQQVEHHEIAVYGTLRAWAGLLGDMEQADVIETILADEKHADILLSGIADRLNFLAEPSIAA